MATFSKKFDIKTNKGAKLQALINVIRLSKDFGYTNILIESDSDLVVGWLQKNLC